MLLGFGDTSHRDVYLLSNVMELGTPLVVLNVTIGIKTLEKLDQKFPFKMIPRPRCEQLHGGTYSLQQTYGQEASYLSLLT